MDQKNLLGSIFQQHVVPMNELLKGLLRNVVLVILMFIMGKYLFHLWTIQSLSLWSSDCSITITRFLFDKLNFSYKNGQVLITRSKFC